MEDRDLGYRTRRLEPPLAPGDTLGIGYHNSVESCGFLTTGARAALVHNRTHYKNFDCLPRVGYLTEVEISGPDERRTHPARSAAAKLSCGQRPRAPRSCAGSGFATPARARSDT